MAYDKDTLYKRAIEVIDKNKLLFLDDLVAMLGISNSTLYKYFPVDSEDLEDLKSRLNKNRAIIKVHLRKKWTETKNPLTQIALYKICATKEEHMLLSNDYRDIDGEANVTIQIVGLPEKDNTNLIDKI